MIDDSLIMDSTLEQEQIRLDHVEIDGEHFYKISNSDAMRPFFMSIVSDSNHWMFISSNGGLSAGRKNAEYSLFPYCTDDKITESADITGSKSIFQVNKQGQIHVWEPFSDRFEGRFKITRNLYKNIYGNKVLFEEINHDLALRFSYQWNSSDHYGFVRKAQLTNNAKEAVEVSILDGVQNVLPYGVGSDLQNRQSNLVDAYKRNELEANSGIGIFALSAIIVDKAEPSEALKANVVWSLGIEKPTYLVSSLQLNGFRRQQPIQQETDIKAEKGAYFIQTSLTVPAESSKSWMLISNVNQDHADIAELSRSIQQDTSLETKIEQSVDLGTRRLIALNAASDGLQISNDPFRDARHFSNTLFNIMRGGIFDQNYSIERSDLTSYLAKANKEVFTSVHSVLEKLPESISLSELHTLAYTSNNLNFRRLCLEYMPLKFSRRHGDPSRPWNRFSINTHNEEDGSKILDYEGNWRDIFQNWEALSLSYPQFIESMIHKFLNASTFDGYNPYRVTKDGFDWEIIEPDDPWSYIGYWGDHQIIYLLKFLEIIENHQPGRLSELFDQELFVYANVPYKIKDYQALLDNPKDTIEFDADLDHTIQELRAQLGADGALLLDQNKQIVRANFIEKILATVLAKLSNFIPEGGIWMNTQRPEWNDANNALVGNGVSMVTLYYLRRFLQFFEGVLAKSTVNSVLLSDELLQCYSAILNTFRSYEGHLQGSFSDQDRKKVLDGLGKAGSEFRNQVYSQSFQGKKTSLSTASLRDFTTIALKFLEHSIRANKREDLLYHAYNLMTVDDEHSISIGYLDEMLEGQVSVLSANYLSPEEALSVLDAMKASKLFRRDQYSYLLYPNKDLKGFMERNTIPAEAIQKIPLAQALLKNGNSQVVYQDINGAYHFNGNFKNANDLAAALNNLSNSPYQELISEGTDRFLELFEQVFNHKAFTGRSGTFYGYEGLGSIYWHMVSKLLLAVEECCLDAIDKKAPESVTGRLLEHFYEINAGIGVHKSPELYGAFPTDPYSHTPFTKGAQQPGMTGQVKEDILSRIGEFGVFVKEGQLSFNPSLLRANEFLDEPVTFDYVDLDQQRRQLDLEKNSLAFTYCQVPIVYTIATNSSIVVNFRDGSKERFETNVLDSVLSSKLFNRTKEVAHLQVFLTADQLK